VKRGNQSGEQHLTHAAIHATRQEWRKRRAAQPTNQACTNEGERREKARKAIKKGRENKKLKERGKSCYHAIDEYDDDENDEESNMVMSKGARWRTAKANG
jgi:hypothetical protein